MKLFNTTSIILLNFSLIIFWGWEIAIAQINARVEAPLFAPNSGFYADSIQVSLSVSSADAVIHYTLDCSDPTEASPIYSTPIKINRTAVVRARAFEAGYDPSKISSHTYILNQRFKIPTLSVITDPANLWGEKGIHTHYDERGDEWERPAAIEFFESDGSLAFSSDVGLRLHGGTSRALAKKSYRYYFRSDYGQSKLRYQLFAPKTIDKFNCFVTSASFQDAPGNSAYGTGTLLRDAVLHEIGRRLDPAIALGTRPVALFLNGQPRGIYNAIERIDKHFLETNFGIEAGDIVENSSEPREGTMARWNELMNFLQTSDLSQASNYEMAESLIDIQNFTRYHIVEIYSGNMDWPDFNNFAYRGYAPGDKWRWLLWDLDNAFAYVGSNSFEIATDDTIRGTLILRKLLQNETYRIYFLNECADFFNTTAHAVNVKAIIDSLAAIIRNDIEFETDRWGGTVEEWEANVQFLKNFADHRLERLWQYILWEFDLEDKCRLTIEKPEGGDGKVRINHITVANFPWQGYYFKDIPIELEAIPNPGYKFVGWSDVSFSDGSQIALTMKADAVVYPKFERDWPKANVVINEINYKSAANFDSEDWVELFNPSEQTIDLSGWHFKDNDNAHDFKFPAGTLIEPLSYLVLCRNQATFQRMFPAVTNFIGDFGFGLSSNGDAVRIYYRSYALVDSVGYKGQLPWPVEANGHGSTLELIDANSDNSLPANWRASPGHGTPGKPNRYLPEVVYLGIKSKSDSINYTNSRDVTIELDATDPDGQVVKWLINEIPTPPTPDDYLLTSRPTSYHIEGEEGLITIYAWVLDNDHQVSRLTSRSHASIKLELLRPLKSKPLLASEYQANGNFGITTFPNPCNPTTTIEFQIPQPSPVRLTIYNSMGAAIRCLIADMTPAGRHQIFWDGKDDRGFSVPSGIYMIQLKSNKTARSSKIIVLR